MTENKEENQYTNSAPSTEELLAEIKSLNEQIEGLKQESESYKEKLLRSAAELQNTISRSKREIEETNKYAISKFAKDLINVHDNLHRALEVDSANSDNSVLIEGIKMTLKEFDNILSKYGVNRIIPEKGTEFDPNLHEALTSVPNQELKENSIIDVIQAGFYLNDRVLRAARVIVSTKA